MTETTLSKEELSAIDRKSSKYRELLTLTLCDLFREKKEFTAIQEIITVLDWFVNDLVIIGVNDSLRRVYTYTDPELEKLSEVLRMFDVGISAVEFVEWERDMYQDAGHRWGRREKSGNVILSDWATERRTEGRKESLMSRYGTNGVTIARADESDGTKRIFDLAPILIKDDRETTYVVDEFDRCLHPVVVYEFTDWFLKKQFSKPKQLIMTTHQIMLMDQDLLRRDEIWFTEKKNDGHSELFSLAEYNERPDRKIDKSYLDGRYGAVPRIDLRRY
jgi:hypothetical protein